jgi:hypothetical protein
LGAGAAAVGVAPAEATPALREASLRETSLRSGVASAARFGVSEREAGTLEPPLRDPEAWNLSGELSFMRRFFFNTGCSQPS